ncbi:MAG TPA: hypothetical protein VL463_16555 [Kofleriaceae bacterium]|nr:hypothetical protein [Kofleriaceae bacterium]
MQRMLVFAALVAASSTGRDARAGARVGIELGRSLAGVDGPGLRLDLGGIQIEGLVSGFYYRQADQDTARSLELEARTIVLLRRFDDGFVGLVGGVAAAIGDHRASAVEGGLHAEWVAVPSVSLGFEVGVQHAWGSEPTTTLAPAAGATFTFWF